MKTEHAIALADYLREQWTFCTRRHLVRNSRGPRGDKLGISEEQANLEAEAIIEAIIKDKIEQWEASR